VTIRQLAALAAASLIPAAGAAADWVYAGAADGLHQYRFDGRLQSRGSAASPPPDALAQNPGHRFVYAASAGNIGAYRIDLRSGKLAPVNQYTGGGIRPCDLASDPSGHWVAAIDCAAGSLLLFAVRPDGGLNEPTQHPAAHATSLVFSPDGRFLLLPAGDRMVAFHFDAASGVLTPAEPQPAAATRLLFHPNGRIVYSLNGSKPTIVAWHFDPATGGLTEFQTASTMPDDYSGPAASGALAVNASGSMVYAANRGADRMALMVVEPVRFTLSALEFTPLVGRAPSAFALDSSGAFLLVADHDSDELITYSVHPRTGQLRPASRPVKIAKPSCLVVVPAPAAR